VAGQLSAALMAVIAMFQDDPAVAGVGSPGLQVGVELGERGQPQAVLGEECVEERGQREVAGADPATERKPPGRVSVPPFVAVPAPQTNLVGVGLGRPVEEGADVGRMSSA
jgi:hypothetical protein